MLAQRGPFSRTQERPGNAPTQAETTSWQAAVVTNGGAVSAARFTTVNNFIAAEKAAGTWALTDDYWGLWAESTPGQAQALTSLKQLRLATAVAAPLFTADRGYTFDGVANYIDTGFVGSTNGINMTTNAGRIAVYERTNVNSSVGRSMAGQGPATAFTLTVRDTNSFAQAVVYQTVAVVSTVPVPDGRGLISVYLKSGPETGWYRNGVLLQTIANTPTFATAPTVSFYIAARNLSGAAGAFRPTSTGFAMAGGPLTPAQEQAQYNNVQAWATAVGANV